MDSSWGTWNRGGSCVPRAPSSSAESCSSPRSGGIGRRRRPGSSSERTGPNEARGSDHSLRRRERATTRAITIAMTTVTTMRLYVTVGLPKIPTVAQFACTTNGPFTVMETSIAEEVTSPVQPENRYVCPPYATSWGARSVACVPAAYQPPASIGTSLVTRTRYSTCHVACAVFGPSITIGFEKAPDDPLASPAQASNASRWVPLIGTIDAFTDASPNDPFAYHPLPDPVPYGVSTVR